MSGLAPMTCPLRRSQKTSIKERVLLPRFRFSFFFSSFSSILFPPFSFRLSYPSSTYPSRIHKDVFATFDPSTHTYTPHRSTTNIALRQQQRIYTISTYCCTLQRHYSSLLFSSLLYSFTPLVHPKNTYHLNIPSNVPHDQQHEHEQRPLPPAWQGRVLDIRHPNIPHLVLRAFAVLLWHLWIWIYSLAVFSLLVLVSGFFLFAIALQWIVL